MLYQKTIKKEIELKGIGIHSGSEVTLKIKPAPADTGVVFFRGDIPDCPPIPALEENVKGTFRGTDLCVGSAEIKTVEHLLSSLSGLSVDNVFVYVYGPEIPIIDGSSEVFAKALFDANFEEQKEGQKKFYSPSVPVWASIEDSHIVALPYDGLKITCVINYKHPLLNTQMEEIVVEPRTYMKSISKARTYAFMEEVQYLLDNNRALGGSLENALIIKEDGFSSPLRYENEPVRHKILDLVGDISYWVYL